MTSNDDRLLLTAREAAAACGVSLRTWRSWDAAGKIPQPRRIGSRTVRWSAAELKNWNDAGCPGRDIWDSTRSK